MKLYGTALSSAAFRVRIALNLKGLAHEHAFVDLGRGAQATAEYLAVNPQGLVPALVDGDVVLTQSMAILEHLEESYNDLPLVPADKLARAQVRSFCLSICCDIHPLNNLRVMQYLKGPLDIGDEEFLTWYAHWIDEGYRYAEQFAKEHSSNGRFVFGDSATLADVFLIPQSYNAHRFKVPLDDYPTLVSIEKACNELPAFKAALPETQPDALPPVGKGFEEMTFSNLVGQPRPLRGVAQKLPDPRLLSNQQHVKGNEIGLLIMRHFQMTDG
ncbi:MAG: maleylacetoacetate isomerase, partial [Planctomycetes bacterium]|nr:maleylacetoacetate isomerase [Planctomycetota bacterium]